MGTRFGRVLFLREYASYIKDNMIAELTDINRNLMMSIDVIPNRRTKPSERLKIVC